MSRQVMERERKAAPSPIQRNWIGHPAGLGCGLVLAVYLGVCLLLFTATRSWIVMASALPAALVAGSWLTQRLYGFVLLLAVRWRWMPQGIRCLLVYSNSPNWEAHVREEWLPRLGPVAVTLNWSERASWPPSLAVRVFRHFCGPYDFNPAVVMFQGLGYPLVFRFYQAFKQVKAGRPEYLRRLEDELFARLEGSGDGRTRRRLLE